jgi:hypothetical protein
MAPRGLDRFWRREVSAIFNGSIGSIGYMLMDVRIGDRAVVQVKLLKLLGGGRG